KWMVDVKRNLKPNSNHLLIHFYSAVKKGKELAAQLGYKLPGDENGKALERKAQYQFGWDWGPRLVTCGVWKKIALEGYSNFEFPTIFYRTTFLDSNSAIITMSSSFESAIDSVISLEIYNGFTRIYKVLDTIIKIHLGEN